MAVALDQHPVQRKTNEYATILETLRALYSSYRHTKVLEMVTCDARNIQLEATECIRRQGAHQFFTLRSGRGTIHQAALDELGERLNNKVVCTAGSAKASGRALCSKGIKDGHTPTQLVRIARVADDDDDETTLF